MPRDPSARGAVEALREAAKHPCHVAFPGDARTCLTDGDESPATWCAPCLARYALAGMDGALAADGKRRCYAIGCRKRATYAIDGPIYVCGDHEDRFVVDPA